MEVTLSPVTYPQCYSGCLGYSLAGALPSGRSLSSRLADGLLFGESLWPTKQRIALDEAFG